MKYTDKRRTAATAISWIMIALIAVYSTAALLAICFSHDPWQRLGLGIMVLFSAPSLLAVLAGLAYIRHQIRPKDSTPTRDDILDAFSYTVSLVLAIITVGLTIMCILAAEWDIAYPYSGARLVPHLQKMMLAFGGLTWVPLCLNIIFQRVTCGKLETNCSRNLRITAIVLVSIVIAAVLLVPTPSGTYNDGGLKIYEAVMYEAVDWNRTREFDGTPIPWEEQHLRIYFFPFNCYEYDAKWEMMH